MKKGKLIVIEGIDGSGKTTQTELLKQTLASQGQILQVISFPRYEDNIYGKLIKRYLEGEFGKAVSPYLMALAYAGDRILAKPQIEKWLNEGKLVLVNRYISSSKAHMGANLSKDKREEFLKWLDELEYQTNQLPKEEITILLNIDPKVGQQNVKDRSPDIHEENLEHLQQAAEIYLTLAKSQDNWYIIDCIKDGKMKSKENIHQEIKQILLNEKS